MCGPALTIALAGCGGGGGGGNSSGPTLGPLVLAGSVQRTPAGAPLSGYTVTFDQNAAQNSKLTATTDANGTFSLSVPRAAVTGTDTLTVTDPSGLLVDTVTVPANTTILATYDAGTLNVSPPTPPAAGI